MLDKLLDEIIARESSKDTNNPNDSGGRTKYGISEKWHPDLWVNGPPTLEQAKQVYIRDYVVTPNFHLLPSPLMEQAIDFGVNSGPGVVVQKLQGLVKVPVDGVMGPLTLAAIKTANIATLNNQLVRERVKMLARIVQKRPSDLEFLYGWITRAFLFLLES